jgi:hypothetical protein
LGTAFSPALACEAEIGYALGPWRYPNGRPTEWLPSNALAQAAFGPQRVLKNFTRIFARHQDGIPGAAVSIA